MSARRPRIRLERACDWPLFSDLALAPDVDVLSVEVSRPTQDTIPVAVADASAILRAALDPATTPCQYKLWLVVHARPVKPYNRVGAYHARRDRLWGALQKCGLTVPEGHRTEVAIDCGTDLTGYAGSIAIDVIDLPVALEVTRRENAVCLGTDATSPDPITSLIPSPSTLISTRRSTLLSMSVARIPDYLFVARAFGEFDDAVVGVDVIAQNPFVTALRQRLPLEDG